MAAAGNRGVYDDVIDSLQILQRDVPLNTREQVLDFLRAAAKIVLLFNIKVDHVGLLELHEMRDGGSIGDVIEDFEKIMKELKPQMEEFRESSAFNLIDILTSRDITGGALGGARKRMNKRRSKRRSNRNNKRRSKRRSKRNNKRRSH